MAIKKPDCVALVGGLLVPGAGVREVARRAVACIADCLAADACHLLVYEAEADALVLEGTWGLEQDAVGDVRLSPTEGVVGRCYRTRKSINSPDMRAHPDYAAFSSVRAREYVSLLAVPLLVEDRVLGVLALSTRAVQTFSRPTVATARAVAGVLARYLEQTGQLASRPTRGASVGDGSRVLAGIAATDGVAHGRVRFLTGDDSFASLTPEYADDPGAERSVFRQVRERVRGETAALERESHALLAAGDAAIFQAHLLLLEDDDLNRRIEGALARGFRLPYALKTVLAEIETEWGTSESSPLRNALADIRDIFLRLSQAAGGGAYGDTPPEVTPASAMVERTLIVARMLLPSQLMRLPLVRLAGIVCEEGGVTSHTVVLARALRIPMLVGVKDAVNHARHDAEGIVDCPGGRFILNPPPVLRARYALKQGPMRVGSLLPRLPAFTRDGVPVRLSGNIALTCELPLLREFGAQGIGLFRTEFLCLTRNAYPDQQEQAAIFQQAVKAAGDDGTTIRLLDVGYDKRPPFMFFQPEANPALGVRGIRYLLANPQYLEPHVRAILQASVHGPVRILLPMVSGLEDVLAARAVIAAMEDQLAREGLTFRRDCRVGVMLEVPSAFFCLRHLLPYIDFVSIGTNDLVQYLFAADRGNDRVAPWYRQLHPTVLTVIRDTCAMVAQFPGRTVSVCGEMAANPVVAALLLGAGVRHFSMSPAAIPKVHAAVAQLSVVDCEALLNQAVAMAHESDVIDVLKAFAARHLSAGQPGPDTVAFGVPPTVEDLTRRRGPATDPRPESGLDAAR